MKEYNEQNQLVKIITKKVEEKRNGQQTNQK